MEGRPAKMYGVTKLLYPLFYIVTTSEFMWSRCWPKIQYNNAPCSFATDERRARILVVACARVACFTVRHSTAKKTCTSVTMNRSNTSAKTALQTQQLHHMLKPPVTRYARH